MFWHSGNLGDSNPWNSQGLARPVQGLLYLAYISNIKFSVLVTDGNNSIFRYIMCGRSEKYRIKIICCQGFYSTSMNILSTAATYTAFSSVWAFKAPFLKALGAEMCISNVKCSTSHQFKPKAFNAWVWLNVLHCSTNVITDQQICWKQYKHGPWMPHITTAV